jgi:hypothetical protein
MKLQAKFLGLVAVASFATITGAHAQYYFQGGTSSDPTVATNYYNGAGPTYVSGSVTDYTNYISQGGFAGNGAVFSSALGTSNLGYFTAGFYVNVITSVTGSTVNFGDTGGGGSQNVIGLQSGTGNNTFAVSGGTVNFLAGDTSDGSSLWIGNAGEGSVTLSGGTITTQNGLIFSRDGGAGNLTITGGLFNVEGTTGTLNDTNSTGGLATITFGLGSGVFEETASDVLSLGTDGFSVNFLTGSGGALSLYSVDGGVTAASLLATNAGAFSITTSGDEATVTLAVPEPSTWAMLIGGFALLLGVQRLSRQRGV